MPSGSTRPRVLVTGGAGYIGSHVAGLLSREGFLPVTYDNLSRGHADAVRFGPLVEGDLRDTGKLARTIRAHGPVGVMHFAAYIAVGESVSRPDLYWDNNARGTLSLLDAMASAGGPRALIFSSTAAVYGDPCRVPIPEDHPLAPVSPYGCTKLAMEMAIKDAAAAWGWAATILRYFNAAGADPASGLFERHDPETHLIPLVLRACLDRRRILRVFGTDYPTPDGTCVRDYIHVMDLAEAHVGALRRLLAGEPGGTFNLGTGRGRSVLEVIEAAARVTGRAPRVTFAGRRAGDPPRLVASPRKARALLGFRPTRSSLGAIIGTAAAALSF